MPGQHFRPIVHKSNAPRPGIEMTLERRAGPAPAAKIGGHAWPRMHS